LCAGLDWFDRVTLALVGIGTIQPSHLLVQSGNAYGPVEAEELERCGAVGDIFLHFFDAYGRPVSTALDSRVVGMSLEQLARVPAPWPCRRPPQVRCHPRRLQGGHVNVW
jgi:DNA-binding transcriptional regulator LsrR (DeoR family)